MARITGIAGIASMANLVVCFHFGMTGYYVIEEG